MSAVMNENWQFMEAIQEDAPEILALYRSELGTPLCMWDEEYPTEREIAFDLSRNALVVLKENGRIIAAVSLDQDEQVEALDVWSKELQPSGELSRLAVAADYQNQGIAGLMIRQGMELLREKGCKSAHFLVSVENEKALRAYAHLNRKNAGECFLYGMRFYCYEKRLI